MLPILNSAFDKTYNYCCLQCRKRIFPINHFFVHALCSIFYEFLPVSERSIGNKAITYVTRDFHGREPGSSCTAHNRYLVLRSSGGEKNRIYFCTLSSPTLLLCRHCYSEKGGVSAQW